MNAVTLEKTSVGWARFFRAHGIDLRCIRWANKEPVLSIAEGTFAHPTRLEGTFARLAPFARAYASVLFCDSPWIGAWFALLTWFLPQTAGPGLLALLCAAAWGRVLGLSKPGEPHLVNSLLTGLVIGALHPVDMQTLAWVAVAALLVTLATHWLAALLWQTGKLPVMSLPFTLASWAVLLTQPDRASRLASMAHLADSQILFAPWLDGFFSSLGWLFLIPTPLAGGLLFLGLEWWAQ